MARLQAIGWRIGDLSSAGVVAGSYVAIALGAWLYSDTAAEVAGVALLALMAGYCWLRTTRRADVFLMWLAPGCVSTFTGDIFGVPKPLVGIPIAVLVVASLIADDRAERRARAQPA